MFVLKTIRVLLKYMGVLTSTNILLQRGYQLLWLISCGLFILPTVSSVHACVFCINSIQLPRISRLQIKFIMYNITDIDDMTEATYVLGASAMGCGKYIAMAILHTKLHKFIAEMQAFVDATKTEAQADIHAKAEHKSQRMNRIYFRVLMFTGVVDLMASGVVLLYQYVRGTADRNHMPLPFMYMHNLGVDTKTITGYLLIYAGCIVLVSSITAILMTTDLLFMNSCIHIVAHCTDVKYVLGRVDATLMAHGTQQHEAKVTEANGCLRHAIHLHDKTLRCAQTINQFYEFIWNILFELNFYRLIDELKNIISPIIFVSFSCGMAILCTVVYHMITVSVEFLIPISRNIIIWKSVIAFRNRT